MAQWSRQFTGRTHSTKVAEREATLRDAVSGYLASSADSTLTSRLRDLTSLADRVIQARRQHLKAELARLLEPSNTPMSDGKIGQVEKQILQLEEGGILAVLKEFHVPGPIMKELSSQEV